MTLQGGGSKRKTLTVGNYNFTGRLLGKGNFARVEEAVHNLLNVKVAVKIINVNKIKEEYVIKNLFREAKVMSKLNHPCIAALYETMKRSENVYYLVTELVSGGDLCSFIKEQRHGRLEERLCRIYARQFVSALSHMHSLGIVHRDLKMENVMLNAPRTQIKIVDFGLSNVWSPDCPLRTHCGSPEYAAPELFITGLDYGAEVDLWSLGIILYGMVVGQLPFATVKSEHVSSQERRKRLVSQIRKGLAAPQRRAIASLSTDFKNMMNRLLVSDATKRLTIKELIVHPWITERGRKLVRTNPIKLLDAHAQSKIIGDIAMMLREQPRSVLNALKEDPLGKIGGLFRILTHRFTMGTMTGDGITKCMPRLSLDIIPPTGSVSSEKSKESEGLKSNPERTWRMPLTDQISSTDKRVGDLLVDENGKCMTPKRPHTVQMSNVCKKTEKITFFRDYRLMKSPSMRRKAYSATLTNRAITPKTTEPVVRGECQEKKAGCSKVVSENLSKRPHSTLACAAIRRLISPKPSRGAEKSPMKKATCIHSQRPSTSKIEKVKPKSVPPDVTMRPTLKTPKIEERPLSRNCEKRPNTIGDGDSGNHNIVTKRENSPVRTQRKPLIYDPIARSIAGYVVNNVPEHLPMVNKPRK